MLEARSHYPTYFLLFLIIAAIFILAVLSNQFFITYLNSDYLYLFETAKFLVSHRTLAGQNQPVAPYYFPDLILLAVFNYFIKNMLVQHFLYALVFLIAYCLSLYQLIRLCFNKKNLALYGTFLALIASFLSVFPHFSFLEEWSGSHLSIILFNLFFIHYYEKNLQRPSTISGLTGLFLLIFFMFLSDKLLFPQFLLPMAFLIILDQYHKKINLKRACVWLGLFLLAILFSLKIEKWLNYFDISTSYNPNLFRVRSIAILSQTILHESLVFLQALKNNLFIYFFLLLLQAPSLFLFKKNNHLSRVILFLWCSQLCNLILVFIAGKFQQIEHLRYLAPLYFYPTILFSLTILFLWEKKKYATFLIIFNIVFISCSVGLFLKTYYPKLQHFNLQPFYPENIRCLDALAEIYAIHNGLANYWYMRDVRLLSHKHLHISQMDRWLNRVNYLDNKAFFYDKGQPLFYQFIIANGLPKDKLAAQLGRPDKIVFCQNEEIWIYQKASHLDQLNNAFVKRQIVQY